MSPVNNANGQARKQLSDQIDRLDTMLDGLADGLNEAVADAVKIAVSTAAKEAMQAALIEVLTNPEIQARLNDARTPPKKPTGPTLSDRFAQLIQNVRTALGNLRTTLLNAGAQFGGWLKEMWTGSVRRVVGLWQTVGLLGRFKWQLLTAAGVGTTIAVGAWFAGPHLSALMSGVGGFCTTLAIQGALWLRRTFGFGVE